MRIKNIVLDDFVTGLRYILLNAFIILYHISFLA